MICDKSYASVPFTWWSTLKRTWARYLNWAKPADGNKPDDSTFHSIRGWLQKDISHISLEKKKTQLNMKVCDKISPTAARGTPSHIRQCARPPVEMWVPSFQIIISGFESFHVGLYLLLELAYRKPQRFFFFLLRCMTKTTRLMKGVVTLSWTAAIAGHNWVKYGFDAYLTLQMQF